MIPPELIERIRNSCENAYPEEACGLVVGPPDDPDSKGPFCQSDRIIDCTNIQGRFHELSPEKYPDTARQAYMMDSAELLGVLSEMKKRGEVLKAIFHSHPDSEAEFSSTDYDCAVRSVDGRSRSAAQRSLSHGTLAERSADLSHAAPKPIYSRVFQIIVSVMRGSAGEAKIFQWSDSLARFVERK